MKKTKKYTKKDTLKGLRKELSDALTQFAAYRAFAVDYVKNDSYRKQRLVLSADAADSEGRLNGLTIVELLAIIKMADQTKERIVLKCFDKTLQLYAETLTPFVPVELVGREFLPQVK